MADDDWSTAVAVLRSASVLVDGIQEHLRRRGFDDVRPVHGFAFVHLSAAPTTTVELARYLSMTKQAAAQLVDHLVARGYVERSPDPDDGRAWRLELTPRGRACTRAAERGAADVIAGWRGALPEREYRAFASALRRIEGPGRLRPAW